MITSVDRKNPVRSRFELLSKQSNDATVSAMLELLGYLEHNPEQFFASVSHNALNLHESAAAASPRAQVWWNKDRAAFEIQDDYDASDWPWEDSVVITWASTPEDCVSKLIAVQKLWRDKTGAPT